MRVACDLLSSVNPGSSRAPGRGFIAAVFLLLQPVADERQYPLYIWSSLRKMSECGEAFGARQGNHPLPFAAKTGHHFYADIRPQIIMGLAAVF